MTRIIIREFSYFAGLIASMMLLVSILRWVPAELAWAAIAALPIAMWSTVGGYSYAFKKLEPAIWRLCLASSTAVQASWNRGLLWLKPLLTELPRALKAVVIRS